MKTIKNKLKQKALLALFFALVAGVFFSCALETDQRSATDTNRKMVGGSVAIKIFLLNAPKTIEFTPGPANDSDGKVHMGNTVVDPSTTSVTKAYEPFVWAWRKISSGDTNYSDKVWPGEEAMTAYSGTNFDDTDEKIENVTTSSNVSYWRLDMKADSGNDMGILFVAGSAGTQSTDGSGQFKFPQTNDVVIPRSEIKKGASFYFIYNKSAYYTDYASSQGLIDAEVTDAAGLEIQITHIKGVPLAPSNFVITDSSSTPQTVTVSAVTAASATEGDSTQAKSILTVSCTSPKLPYKIIYTPTGGKACFPVYAAYSSSVIDGATDGLSYSGDDLGLTLGGDRSATFKVWSPTASEVKLLLFKTVENCGKKDQNPDAWAKEPKEPKSSNNPECKEFDMTLNAATHAWEKKLEKTDYDGYEYYKYRLRFYDKLPSTADTEYVNDERKCINGIKWLNTIECVRKDANGGAYTTFDVSDIWGKVTTPDSTASIICDIKTDSRTIPTDWVNDKYIWSEGTHLYSDAVIYEMNIADWGEGKDCKGKFNTLTKSRVIDHLKDLGITHVALMPITDNVYTNVDTRYNWGFCAYHYNAIESRYVVGANTGLEAVRQLRTLVKAFHDAGIGVIMDVDYVHTGNKKYMGGSQSLYDSTVPRYFYRIINGEYSNGANQGTEIAAARVMVKKYIIDSLKHWMEDFHIDGFSFYLMGLTESSVMKEVYDALKAINPNVIVYGEGWTGGRENGVGDKGTVKAILSGDNGVATLAEGFRTGIKGKELRGFTRGAIQGDSLDKNIPLIIDGLKGLDSGYEGNQGHNDTEKPQLSIHYIETHDDNTLFDKLLLSRATDAGRGTYRENTVPLFADLYKDIEKHIDIVKKEDTLGAAMVILAQGTPFISSGQEFLRTKKGNADSSEAGRPREYTWIEKKLIECNAIDLSMADTYNDIFCTYRGLIALRKENPSAFGANTDATASEIATGVIKYQTGGYTVYFNTTDADAPIDDEGYLIDTGGGVVSTGFDSIMSHSFTSTVAPYTQSTQKSKVLKVEAKSFLIIKN